MRGLDPRIHAFAAAPVRASDAWMAGSSPAKTCHDGVSWRPADVAKRQTQRT